MRTLYILLFLLLPLMGMCQEAAFVIIDVSGSVMHGNGKKALIGAQIQNNEAITVEKGGSVTLACRNSGYARFNTPGRYLANTTTYCRAAPDAAFAKLCKFAWRQVSAHEASEDWRNHMENVGAASRGGACGATVDRNLSDIYFYKGDFVISCKPTSAGTPLFLNLFTNENSAAFMQLPLSDNQYALKALKSRLKENTDYYWNIAPKDKQCAAYNILHIVTKQQRDSVVNNLTKSVSAYITNKAEQQYMLGYLLENKHYFADALACYKEAARLEANNERYRHAVAQFNERYGMK